MYILFFILFLILIIAACAVVYKTAEVHELHKMRAAFEDKRRDIKRLIEEHKTDGNELLNAYYQGELEEIEEVESIINENIHLLKYFDFGNSD